MDFERFTNTGKQTGTDFNRSWRFYGSTFGDYLIDFRSTESTGKLREISRYVKSQQAPIVIDLLADVSALYDLKNRLRKKPIKGLAAQLDSTCGKVDAITNYGDGIGLLNTDLGEIKKWDMINEWLGQDKAHLIIERGFGGLDYVPTNRSYQRKVIGKIWDMLSPKGGYAILQTPPQEILEKRNIPVRKWLRQLQNTHVEYQFSPRYKSRDSGESYGILILRRTPDVSTLPTLAAREA